MKKITIVGLGNMGLNFINSVNKDFKKNISDIEINSLLLIPKELDKDFIINNIQKNHQIFVVAGLGGSTSNALIELVDILKRIKAILDLLNQGLNLSTPKLVERFGVSKKIIQTDFKDFILPLFPNETIYYDYSLKTYKAKNNFLSKTLFNSKELAIISILKNKSTDKYSDIDLKANVDELFYKFEKELSNQLYSKSSVEKIDKFKNELIQLENAIENKNIVKCFYNNKHREIYPLKILNLEEFWYLIVFEPIDNKIKTFHLNTIKNVEVLHNKYSFDKTKIDSFKNAINAYHKLDSEKISVILFANKEVSRYFLRKPLNQTQRVLKQYDDKSIDFEIVVTNLMEIIPTIQRYIPHLKVIEPLELKEAIKKNIDEFVKVFEWLSLGI